MGCLMPESVPDPTRACFRKRRYDTEEDARQVTLTVWRDRDVALRLYFCSACGGYHVTKMGALPPSMRPGWRPPRQSARQAAHERRRKGRRRD
jgi:hypothetical protein